MRADRRHRRSGIDGSFWLSFSDLMSSLVLIIILVMFYIIYQYFNEAEMNAKVIAAREAELDTMQAELTVAQTNLTTAQDELTAAQADLKVAQDDLDTAQQALSVRETELATAQADLDTATTSLAEREALVAQQQSQLATLSEELAGKQSEIDSQQLKLDEQQAVLDAQQEQLDTQQAQIEELVGMRTRIVTSISEAFKANNINAKVDPSNGSIALESDVLFTSGEFELAESGRHFLDVVLPIYLNVLFSDEYRSYVTEVIVEGHTDSDGTWLDNMQLSQQRALAVVKYVFSADCSSISADIKNEFRNIVTVNGRSYSERVFDQNGAEDKDASRRVVFKFRLTDERMIAQLQQILENEGAN